MGYENIGKDESRVMCLYDKAHSYDVRLVVANTLDYTRFTIRAVGKRSSLEADVYVGYDFLKSLIQSIEGTESGPAFLCDDYCGDRTTLVGERTEDGDLVLRIEVVKGKDLSITLSKADANDLVRTLQDQIEAVEARPCVEKTYGEWERIAKANADRGRQWYSDVITEQIHYRGLSDGDLVVCVFDDEYDVEGIMEVTTVQLSATVDTWQRTAEYLRNDRNESLALAVEDAVIEHFYGASPIQQVELSFDWNDAPGIEDALWRVALLGDYAEATKPFVSLVMVG